MFVGQSSFILKGRKVALAERRRHNDWLMWSYDLMFANYHDSKFAWRLTLSLDLFSCCLNSSAQRRLPDFTASTRLSDKFKMAVIADDATVTRFSKWEEYSIEDVDSVIACANFRRGNPIWACAPTPSSTSVRRISYAQTSVNVNIRWRHA